MGYDSIKKRVGDYTQKKNNIDDEDLILRHDESQLDSILQGPMKLDADLQEKINSVYSVYLEERSRIDGVKRELELEKEDITDSISEEIGKLSDANGKLSRVETMKYGKEAEKAKKKSDEFIKELKDMLKQIDGTDAEIDFNMGNNVVGDDTFLSQQLSPRDDKSGNSLNLSQDANNAPKNIEPNNSYTINGNTYETDDNGNAYKTNGELNPNTGYTVNGISYTTDSAGRIVSWEGNPGYNPEADRDGEAQTEAGGEDRKEGDDGGHLVARVLDGPPGKENIVPMRATINRGDYKKTENEIAKAKQEGKDVHDSGTIIYKDGSTRPSMIVREYSIDGEKRIFKMDNIEGSQDLLKDLKHDISEDDYLNQEDRINDMQEDGSSVSVTSVLNKYDLNGNLMSVIVGIRDETSGTKTYITYDAK